MMEGLLVGDPVEWLLASPVYLFLLLALLSWLAFRAPGQSRLRRLRWPLLLLLVWAYLSSTPALANRLLANLEMQYGPPLIPAGAAYPGETVVLASGDPVDPARPGARQLDLASLRRTDAAVQFWRAHGGQLIFVGSSYPSERRPVAGRMAALAVSQGVPRGAIGVAEGSVNTYQNFLQLKHDGRVGKRFFLVTSAAHMPRAVRVARAQGMTPIPVPCDYRAVRDLGWRAWIPNNRALTVFSYALHEIVGLQYYRLRGRI